MNEAQDELETMLIMALDLKTTDFGGGLVFGDPLPGRGNIVELDIPSVKPKSAFVSLAHDETMKYFGARIQDAMTAEKVEMAILDASGLSLNVYKRATKLPRGISVSGRIHTILSMHKMTASPDGTSNYAKDVVAVDRNGEVLPMFAKGVIRKNLDRTKFRVSFDAAVAKSSVRDTAMLASVAESMELMFPVPLDDYKKVFSTREAPLTAAGKRKAILHWVGAHLRKSPSGGSVVKSHARGVDEFTWGGIKTRVGFNKGPD